MNLNNITPLEDFESGMDETVCLYLTDPQKPDITHFLYLTTEQVAEIVKIDKLANQIKAQSEVPGQGKYGPGQGSHILSGQGQVGPHNKS